MRISLGTTRFKGPARLTRNLSRCRGGSSAKVPHDDVSSSRSEVLAPLSARETRREATCCLEPQPSSARRDVSDRRAGPHLASAARTAWASSTAPTWGFVGAPWVTDEGRSRRIWPTSRCTDPSSGSGSRHGLAAAGIVMAVVEGHTSSAAKGMAGSGLRSRACRELERRRPDGTCDGNGQLDIASFQGWGCLPVFVDFVVVTGSAEIRCAATDPCPRAGLGWSG